MIRLVTKYQLRNLLRTGFWVLNVLSISAVVGQYDFFEQTTVQPSIIGELSLGCYDCYPCGDYRVKHPVENKLTITNKDNQVTEVCCDPQTNLKVSNRDGEACGMKKEVYNRDPVLINGKKQKRKTARSILYGDYPWRVFIYNQWTDRKEDEEKAICAGTVIDPQVRYILTSASCVHKYRPHSLAVSFTRFLDDPIDVQEIMIHEHYNEHNPFVNDIALLLIEKSRQVPSWAAPVCLSNLPPLPAAWCVVMSDEDKFIDTITVSPKNCTEGNTQLHVSQICSVTNIGDYKAELGSGLFCRDQLRTSNIEYYAFGITLQIRNDRIIHTNVSHFETWITEKTPYIP